MAIGTVLINGTKYEIGGGAIRKYQHNITGTGQYASCTFQIMNSSSAPFNSADLIITYLNSIGNPGYPATGWIDPSSGASSSAKKVVTGIKVITYGSEGDQYVAVLSELEFGSTHGPDMIRNFSDSVTEI